jgi:DHA2 family multidrug resistance protein
MTATAEHTQAAPPAAAPPPAARNPYIGVLGVFLGAATSQLNGKLLTAGLPDLRGTLGYSFDGASWIPTALNMGMMFTAVFAAFLGTAYGIRRVLLISGAVFTAASIVLPFAGSLGVMLALQVIAGVAVGSFYTLTFTFVARNLPKKLVLFGIAAYAMDIVVSSHVGFFIHGWYMDHLSWRWIFWTSAVLMPLTMLCVYFGIAPSGQPERPNWRGFLYMSAGLSLIYGALDQGQRLDWWRSGTFVGMLAGGVLLLGAALLRRYFHPNPLLNLRFLSTRNVIIIGLGIFTIRFSLLGSLIVVPSFLGAIQQYRPLQTGAALAWMAAPQFVVVWIAAIVAVFIQPRIVMAAGFATVATGCWMAAHVDSTWAGKTFVAPELVIAIGIGVAFVGLVTNIVLILVEQGGLTSLTNTTTYSAFMHTIRMMGGQIGAVALGRFIAVREQFHSNVLGQYVDAGNWMTTERLRGLAAAMTPFSAGPDEAQARSAALLASQVRAQAFTLAYSDAFLLIAWLIAAYLVLAAFMRPATISLRPQEQSK